VLKSGNLNKLKKLNKAMKARKRLALDKFKKLRHRMFRNMKPGFLKCKILRAEPVDSVTGEVVVEQQDFSIPSRYLWNGTVITAHTVNVLGYVAAVGRL
jgi:hypothetical protein